MTYMPIVLIKSSIYYSLNLYVKGKYTTKQLHTLVYKTFKGDINSKRGEYIIK